MNLEKLTEETELLSKILDCLQKRKRIEILLFIHDQGVTQWGDLKKEASIEVAGATFRSACRELVTLGLVEPISIAPLKNKWRLTDFGCLIADIMKRAVRDIGSLIQAKRYS